MGRASNRDGTAGARGRIVELFSPDFYCDSEAVRRAITQRRLFNIIHLERIVKVDLIVRKADAYSKKAMVGVTWARAVRVISGSRQLRIRMACEMFQAGRAMVCASLIDRGIQEDSEEMKVQLLHRTYWRDFPAAELETIARAVRARFHRQAAEALAG